MRFSPTVISTTFKLLLLITITSVYSFKSTRNAPTRFTSVTMSSRPSTYAEMLQASKLAKLNNGAVPRPAVAAAPVARAAPSPAVNVRGIADTLPFDDVIYDHLKFVIGMLL